MAYDVLTKEELEFIHEHADEIKKLANSEWAGHMPMDKREIYQTVFLKAGGRQAICWSCGGSLRKLGMKLKELIE